jgi:signal transduction histidine kinase
VGSQKIHIGKNIWVLFQQVPTFIRYGLSSKIGQRFVFRTLLCSTFFAIFVTSIQLFIDFRSQQSSLNNSIRKIENAIVPSLTESLWALDDPLINSQLSGIVNVDGVVYVKLTDTDGLLIDAGVKNEDVSETHKLDLTKIDGEQSKLIGELTIGVSYSNIYNELINRAAIVLLASILKTFVLSIAILFIYQNLIGRHIFDLAKFAHQYSPENRNQYFALNRKANTQNEDELSQLEASINRWLQMNKKHINKLNEVNHELSTFTYSLSHDLKSPINTVQMSLVTIKTESEIYLDDKTKYMMNLALQTNERMRTIIDDTLEYARASEEIDLKSEINLKRFITEVIDDLQGEISMADATINFGKLPTVIGNSTLIRILFQNLLSNAIKFRSPDRKPIITVSSKDQEDPNFCVIKVTDNGIGIDTKYHDKIFGQFERLHTYKEYPGTGLGLSVCKKIVTKLGGKIRISSVVGEGTTFEIDLMKAGKGQFE